MTSDSSKTKAELLEEIAQLRRAVANDSSASFFNAVPLPYHSLDEQGRVLAVNRAWVEAFGYSEDKVVGRWFGDFLTPDSVRLLREQFPLFLASGEVGRTEFTIIHCDGRLLSIAIDGRIARDESGAFKRTHCILHDVTEQRRVQAEIRENEERYRMLADNSEDVIWTVDNEFNYTYISPSSERFRGYMPDELLGTNLADAMPPVSFASVTQAYSRVLDAEVGGGPDVVGRKEIELYHKDGSMVWAEVVTRPLRDGNGRHIGFIGVSRNIEERKQAEQRLREKESTLKALLDATTDAVSMIGLDGSVLAMNENMAGGMGFEVDEIVGNNILDYLPEEVTAERTRKFLEAVERKEPVRGRDVRTGRIIDCVYYPVLGDGGEVVSVAVYARDVTESILNEEARKQSEMQYKRIVETANEGIIGLDADGNITYANSNTSVFLGYPVGDLHGRSLFNLVVPGDREAQRACMERRARGMSDLYERRFVRKDGKIVWGLVSATPLQTEHGAMLGSFAMITDITERKRAEDALRLTQFSVDKASLGIFWIDAEGRFVYVNDSYCDNLGHTKEEMLHMSVADIMPDLRPEDWPEYWEERRKEVVRTFELVHRRKDGSEFPAEITSHYREYDGRELLFGFAYDLTKRHKRDEKLRRNQELLNEVQRISLTGGWEVDLETGRSRWTEGLYRLHGLNPSEDLKGIKPYFEKYIHPEDRDLMFAAWSAVFADKKPNRMEYRIVRDDGSEPHFLSVAIPELDGEGNVRRVYGSTRDVTSERQAAEELQQAHERLLAILDSIDADVYVSDIHTHEVLFMNNHMKRFFGTPLPGIPCHQAFRGETNMCSHCAKPRLLDSRGNPRETVIYEGYNSLSDRWYLNHDRAIRWLEGRMVHMHMAADITDLKNMEEELKGAMEKAEAANLAKNEFLANMSHEIRTPLNGLLGMLQILQLTNLDEEQRDHLNTAFESGRNLFQILNDILDLSKIESGKLELDECEFELGELLDSVVSVFRKPAESRGLSMSWVIDESLPRNFIGDMGRLRQILFNLVGNAAKFTESGSVVVKAFPLPHQMADGRILVLFSVEDTGIGIPDNKVESVFDPFIQVDGSSTRKYQGTGLGLGIVHRLVALMRGSIAVDSLEGRGTSIMFTAAARTTLGKAKLLDGEVRPTLNRSLSVLVAEDERVNRMVAQRLLSRIGHEVVCVENGEAALEELRKREFDCVLMDIQMPGLNGLETTRAIRESMELDLPVIALTAHAMKGDRERFIAAGMNGYVPKPFELDTLKKELGRVMADSDRRSGVR